MISGFTLENETSIYRSMNLWSVLGAAKIHAYIMSHLKKEMPVMMGKAKAQQRLSNA